MRVLEIGSLVFLSLSAPLADAAAQTAEATGNASGTVFDSLSRKPLSRASIRIQGTELATVADSSGRFTFSGIPPGRHLFTWAAPSMENSGLRSAGVAAEIVAGQTTIVNLATPSLARLWQVLCAGRPRLSADSGIITGTIADGDRNLRLRKAPAALSWFDLKRAGDFGIFPEVRAQVETDSLGAFVACGIPTDVSIKTKAFGDDAASGEVKFFVGPLHIRRVDLVVTKALASTTLARGTATLRGTVRDSTGRPVADAIVSVPAADTSTRTNAEGTFVLRGLAPGSQGVEVRKVGFGMATPYVNLRAEQESFANVVMSGVTMLDTYAVRGDRSSSFEVNEFMERQKLGFGTNFDFTKNPPYDPLAPLRTVPRIRVSLPGQRETTRMRDGRDSVIVRRETQIWMSRPEGTRRCIADLYLDGRKTEIEAMAMYPISQLAAMEVYTTPSSAPARFFRPVVNDSIGGCGVILYWTKAALQR